MTIDPQLLDLLVCPRCHSPVQLVDSDTALQCMGASCGLVYPIRDGIPVMLIDEAHAPGDPPPDDGE